MKRPSPRQFEALRLVAEGRFLPALVKEEDGWHARWLAADDGGNPWVDEFVRSASISVLSEDAEDQRHETLHDAWALALRSRTGLVRWDEDECRAFARELTEWSGSAEEDAAARGATVFRFRPDAELLSLECAVPRGRAQYKALGQAAYVWGALRELKVCGEGAARRLHLPLERSQAEDFLRRGARDLAAAGYKVEGVDLSAAITAGAEVDGGGPEKDDPVEIKLEIKIDGERVGAEEIRFLLEQGSSLVFFRDRWIEVDRSMLKEALKALEGNGSSRSSPLAFALGIGAVGRMEFAEAESRGWLRGLVNRLRQSRSAPSASGLGRIEGLNAELRAYQRHGVEWMKFLTDNGFGALLADDMGLGKTVQTVAWILACRRAGSPPVLIVAPLTLLSNWRHELAKFAPSLKVYVHHGEGRHLASGFRREASAADVVVTAYSLLVRDHREISETEWFAAVLDEAQAVKNPDTRAARAIRALGARRRIALTGTPIENSVMDIWSIEEFLNPGFLGDRRSFAERFGKPLSSQGAGSARAARLARALEPFVMRRLKTDPAIAGELSLKEEIREFCRLSPSQRADYETALAEYRAGERRQGDVFALLTRLKLICDGEGKLARLEELLESVFESGESALIFTQYVKVGRWLRGRLEEKFGRRFPFLHGALGVKEREAEIERFRSDLARPDAFILSLKAGGFGLNLTKASHVIHFDRWWNPAVENQATDRAHRIGQERPVFVHAFVTEGTLEERIEEILARKGSIAGILKDGGEFWSAVKLDE